MYAFVYLYIYLLCLWYECCLISRRTYDICPFGLVYCLFLLLGFKVNSVTWLTCSGVFLKGVIDTGIRDRDLQFQCLGDVATDMDRLHLICSLPVMANEEPAFSQLLLLFIYLFSSLFQCHGISIWMWSCVQFYVIVNKYDQCRAE